MHAHMHSLTHTHSRTHAHRHINAHIFIYICVIKFKEYIHIISNLILYTYEPKEANLHTENYFTMLTQKDFKKICTHKHITCNDVLCIR